ncbi:MAG: hypothetical protein ACRDDF_04140, partial [Aeromonas sp.]
MIEDNVLINKHSNLFHYDLASAAKTIAEFHGNETDDIMMWLAQVRMMCSISDFNEAQSKCLILMRLRGTAQQWAATIYDHNPDISLKELSDRLLDRFENTTKIFEKTNKFLARKCTSNTKDFLEMLAEA